jgi:hypothetical protein
MYRVAWLKRQEEGEDEIVATPLMNMPLGAIGFFVSVATHGQVS